jgi:hypothetical protein
MSDKWSFIDTASVNDLVPINPYSKSKFRSDNSNALAIWDSAIGVPANKVRGDTIISQKALVATKTTNREWETNTIPALSRVGYLAGDNKFLRPKGNYITDLMYSPIGWKILEGAHILAHRLQEQEYTASKSSKYVYGSNASTMIDFIVKICAAIEYNLPIDVVMSETPNEESMDGFNRYGIALNTSAQFRSPILSLPATGNGVIEPDTTIAVLCGSVHIEPHPHSLDLNQESWKEINRWSCEPSMCVLAGWEFIDVVMHQPLVSTWWTDTVQYSMQPMSLKEMKDFNALLELAKTERGEAIADNIRYWNPLDWFESNNFQQALMLTPTLPCKDCMRLNMKAEGAPERPRCKMPDKDSSPNSQEVKEWEEWDNKIQKVLGITETAVLFYEARKVGMTKAKKQRKERNKNHKNRIKTLNKIDRLTKACEKLYADGRISKLNETLKEIEDLTNSLNSDIIV